MTDESTMSQIRSRDLSPCKSSPSRSGYEHTTAPITIGRVYLLQSPTSIMVHLAECQCNSKT